MAREVDAEKAEATIIKLFKQENLKGKRVEIIKELVLFMSSPVEDKISNKYESLKKELEYYKKAAGSVIREHVNSLMKEEK